MTPTQAGDAKRKMKRLKKVALGTAGGLVTIVLALVLACQFLGVRSKADLIAYQEMWRERYHPVWRDLALRRFRSGSNLERLVNRHGPSLREDAGPYAKLVYEHGAGHLGVTAFAKDGLLTAAVADTTAGRHVFFYDLQKMQDFGTAHREYTEHKQAEAEVCRIHRAIRAGRDVALARGVRSSDPVYLVYKDRARRELARQLNEVDKKVRLETEPGFEIAATAEVAKVLSGDLEPGATVTVMIDKQHEEALHAPEIVFLQDGDAPMRDADGRGQPRYWPISQRGWELYQSLTAEQIEELADRQADREVKDGRPQGSNAQREDSTTPD